MSEFENLGLKYKNLQLASEKLCMNISLVVAELNSGVPAESDMVKGELNYAINRFIESQNGELFSGKSAEEEQKGV